MATAHVPAWQRLGLKLKKNQDLSSPASSTKLNTHNAGATPLKRKAATEGHEVQDSPTIVKKSKRKNASIGSPDAIIEPTSNGTHSPDARRKSVTFSHDTKAEDGDSSKRISQAAYASRLSRLTGVTEDDINAATAEFEQRGATSANGSKALAARDEADVIALKARADLKKNASHAEESKQPKKTAAKVSSKVELARQKKKQDSAIQYLNDYKNKRAEWKFNKARQNAVLKVALQLDTIPREHDNALKSYLEGLQGRASRSKLSKEAITILEGSNIGEEQKERANLIIEALGPVEEEPEETVPLPVEAEKRIPVKPMKVEPLVDGDNSSTGANGIANGRSTGGKKKRRRRGKKRRNASDSDSDSSSSSSSDSSDSD